MLSLSNTYSREELLEFHNRIVKTSGKDIAYVASSNWTELPYA